MIRFLIFPQFEAINEVDNTLFCPGIIGPANFPQASECRLNQCFFTWLLPGFLFYRAVA